MKLNFSLSSENQASPDISEMFDNDVYSDDELMNDYPDELMYADSDLEVNGEYCFLFNKMKVINTFFLILVSAQVQAEQRRSPSPEIEISSPLEPEVVQVRRNPFRLARLRSRFNYH